ncbi:hypothetical protein AVEN_3657-1 [Araneus ventricosus]|uniref:Uncharacterized protein n=1 Tax=Araneus ventricosus TaxID=182803 RepID=A0A4Y2WV64_ARAVE|nr:hypothetical protein AVEN_3657-1 [Araneus ventricosus]
MKTTFRIDTGKKRFDKAALSNHSGSFPYIVFCALRGVLTRAARAQKRRSQRGELIATEKSVRFSSTPIEPIDFHVLPPLKFTHGVVNKVVDKFEKQKIFAVMKRMMMMKRCLSLDACIVDGPWDLQSPHILLPKHAQTFCSPTDTGVETLILGWSMDLQSPPFSHPFALRRWGTYGMRSTFLAITREPS